VPEHQVDRAPPPDDPDRIARVIASLDGEFERRGAADPSARAAYEEERNTLKARLKSALDGRRGKE
jgi:chorismate mutase